MIKIKSFRSGKYLSWVRSMPCSHCGTTQGVEAHHLIGVGGMGGMGMKAPDSLTMPLCRACHSSMHSKPEMWLIQWEYICRTVARAVDEGVLKVG